FMDVQDSPTIIATTKDETQPVLSTTEEGKSMTRQSAWPDRVAPWWQATLAILPAFLLTRCIFVLLTYFGTVLFTVPNYSSQALPLSAVLRGLYHWYVIIFANIA